MTNRLARSKAVKIFKDFQEKKQGGRQEKKYQERKDKLTLRTTRLNITVSIVRKSTRILQLKIGLCATIVASEHTKTAVMDRAHLEAIYVIFIKNKSCSWFPHSVFVITRH